MASAVNIPVNTKFDIRVSQSGFSQGIYLFSLVMQNLTLGNSER